MYTRNEEYVLSSLDKIPVTSRYGCTAPPVVETPSASCTPAGVRANTVPVIPDPRITMSAHMKIQTEKNLYAVGKSSRVRKEKEQSGKNFCAWLSPPPWSSRR